MRHEDLEVRLIDRGDFRLRQNRGCRDEAIKP